MLGDLVWRRFWGWHRPTSDEFLNRPVDSTMALQIAFYSIFLGRVLQRLDGECLSGLSGVPGPVGQYRARNSRPLIVNGKPFIEDRMGTCLWIIQ
jgi:hypothetical protein